jgi:hypothetical protein
METVRAVIGSSAAMNADLRRITDGKLTVKVLRYLPSLLAELEARRAQAGDIPNAAGFTPRATLEMK